MVCISYGIHSKITRLSYIFISELEKKVFMSIVLIKPIVFLMHIRAPKRRLQMNFKFSDCKNLPHKFIHWEFSQWCPIREIHWENVSKYECACVHKEYSGLYPYFSALTERRTMEEKTVETWDNEMAVNLTAPFLLSKHFVKSMKEKGI